MTRRGVAAALVLAALLLSATALGANTGTPTVKPVPIESPPLYRPLQPSTAISAVGCTRDGSCVSAISFICPSPDSCDLPGPAPNTLVQGEAPDERTAVLADGLNASAIACPAAGQCVAVGDRSAGSGPTARGVETVDRLAAGRWHHLTVTGDFAAGSDLNAVACPAVSRCIAVGTRDNTARPDVVMIGSDDTTTQSLPVRGLLRSVACASLDFCVAAGQSDAQHNPSLIEMWNGRRWARARGTAVDFSRFDSVSCPSPARCIAIGENGFSAAPLAELWNGHSWSRQSLPAQLAGGQVSCRSTRACVAVSDQTIGTWRGADWTLQTIAGHNGPFFDAVSCSASSCLVVGDSDRTDQLEPVALRGFSRFRSVPIAIRQPGTSRLTAVGCASARSCLGVGEYAAVKGRQVIEAPIVERWNGHRWHLDPGVAERLEARDLQPEAVACPEGHCAILALAPYGRTGLYFFDLSNHTLSAIPGAASGLSGAMSCPTPDHCVVAANLSNPRLNAEPAFLAWSGGVWRLTRLRRYPFSVTELNSISCASARSCTAVGDYNISSHDQTDDMVIEHFNGVTWTKQRPAGHRTPDGIPGELNGVECPRVDECLAVGAGAAPVQLWTGAAWTAVPAPANLDPTGIACAGIDRCTLIGENPDFVSTAGEWDGQTVTELATPDPGTQALAAACPTPGRCEIVGQHRGGEGAPVAEQVTYPGA